MSNVVPPTCRQLLVAEDLIVDAGTGRVYIHNLMSNLVPHSEPRYPYVRESLWVFAQITGCHGPCVFQIICYKADTDAPQFGLRPRGEEVSTDPLHVHGLRYRIRNCRFSEPGLYFVRLLCEGNVIGETPLLLR